MELKQVAQAQQAAVNREATRVDTARKCDATVARAAAVEAEAKRLTQAAGLGADRGARPK
jgi:hypothetical protein